MTDPTPRYERLCRGWWGLNGRGAIWLGSDHLLHSSSIFAIERYQRWYFRDVQALIARRTHARLVWNLVVGGGGLLIAFGATSAIVAATSATNSGDIAGFIILASVLGVVALACFSVVVWNTLLGPTCTVWIVTPRGMEKLPGVGRFAAFNKLFARLQPLTSSVSANAGLREVATALEPPQQ